MFLAGNPEYNTATVRFNYQSMITPSSVYDYDMNTRQRKLLKQQEVLGGYDAKKYEAKRIWAVARDGTLYIQEVPKVALPGAELLPPDPAVRLAFVGEDRILALDEPIKNTRGEFLPVTQVLSRTGVPESHRVRPASRGDGAVVAECLVCLREREHVRVDAGPQVLERDAQRPQATAATAHRR